MPHDEPTTAAEAQAVARLTYKLFGDKGLSFRSGGLWHIGRLTDDLPGIRPHGKDPKTLFRRPMQIFAVAPTLTEAMRTFTGGGRIYSGPGMSPGVAGATGYKPIFDKRGQIRGYRSPAGVFTRRFPAPAGD